MHRNRGTDVESRLADTVGEREGRTDGQRSTDIHTTMCKMNSCRDTAAGQHREASSAMASGRDGVGGRLTLRDDLGRGGGWGGREAEKGGGTCTHTADSLCCMAESDTTL